MEKVSTRDKYIKLLDEYYRKKKSVKSFCAQKKLNERIFLSWKKKLKSLINKSILTTPLEMIPVKYPSHVESHPTNTSFNSYGIVLRNGIRLCINSGYDISELQELASTMEQL